MQTDFSPVDDNKCLLRLAPLNNVNHVVVFLTGTAPLPDQLGAGGNGYISIGALRL